MAQLDEIDNTYIKPPIGAHVPVTIEDRDKGDLALWAARNAGTVSDLIARYGAIRFTGFRVLDVADFRRAFTELAGDPIKYIEQSSPRHELGDKIYTSTEYDPARKIFLHNEQSYNINFPQYISFYCEVEPEVEGQTPLADTRRILKRIDPRVRDRLAEIGYLYVRNFGGVMSMPWQTAFQLRDAESVEAYCEENDISFVWLDGRGGKRLRTEQRRSVIARHPTTGEAVWFNHLTFFHRLSLDPDLRWLIDEACGDINRPHGTYYGDGTPIEEEVVTHLREAYMAEETVFQWRACDVLLIDNMLVSHGRQPFKGPRKIAAAMSVLRNWHDVDTKFQAPTI